MANQMMGDNVATPYAEGVTERLEQDFGELLINAGNVLGEAEHLPETVLDSTDVARIASIVVKLRDLSARGKSHRAAEKEPYLRAGDAVFAFFTKRIVEPLDVCRAQLQGRIDAFKQRQLAEERRRREQEAIEARKALEKAQRERDEAEALARRARSAANIKERNDEARRLRVEADIADAKAEETTLATMQTATKIVGERFEGERSGQVGMRKTPLVVIEDIGQLDLELLRPFLREEHLLMALRQWAKATNYEQQMPGATVALRDTTVVR